MLQILHSSVSFWCISSNSSHLSPLEWLVELDTASDSAFLYPNHPIWGRRMIWGYLGRAPIGIFWFLSSFRLFYLLFPFNRLPAFSPPSPLSQHPSVLSNSWLEGCMQPLPLLPGNLHPPVDLTQHYHFHGNLRQFLLQTKAGIPGTYMDIILSNNQHEFAISMYTPSIAAFICDVISQGMFGPVEISSPIRIKFCITCKFGPSGGTSGRSNPMVYLTASDIVTASSIFQWRRSRNFEILLMGLGHQLDSWS